MGYIYKITSPSGKIYVGKTYDVRKRINSHKCAAKKDKNFILSNSIRKHGWDAHVFEIIENVADDMMDEREMFWIAELKSYCLDNPDGMNMTLGGDGQRSSWMHDVERRESQSKAFSGINNPFYGRKHSEETKRLLSERAKKISKETGRNVPKWGVEKGREKVRKPVLCYNSNGDFLKEYNSATEAAKDCNISKASEVCAVCSGKRTNAKGFVFRYKIGDNIEPKIEVDKIGIQGSKRPVLLMKRSKEGLVVDKEYSCVKEASEKLGIPKTTIARLSRSKMRQAKSGHIFIYKDLYVSPTAVGVI